MKKIFAIALVCVMLAAIAMMPVSANRGLSFAAEYGTPTIDGKADEWDACTTYATVDLSHNGSDTQGESATVKAMWDEEYLYFLVEAKDASLSDGECFEFYFDETYDKSTAFNKNDRQSRIYVQTGEILDSTKDEDGNDTSRKELYDQSTGWGFSKTSDGWICEVAFKWTGFNAITEGMTIGAEFMWDDQGAGLALRWNVDTNSGDTAPYQCTADFGALTLNAPVYEEEEEVADEAAAADDAAAAAEAPKAAKTVDAAAIALIVMAVTGSGIVVSKKH